MREDVIQKLRQMLEENKIKDGKMSVLLAATALRSLPALLDVAEAARVIREEHAGCDFGPAHCSGCRLDAALARLEEAL